MSGFTKLVPEIIQSSIWNEPAEIRCVWIAMIATKDANGYVRGDARTISRMANVSLESAETALLLFQEPDPSSHTPDNEGRRIAPAPGGWIILNHELYRSRDPKQEHADYMREWRVKKEPKQSDSEKRDSHVIHSDSQRVHRSASVSVSASDKNIREEEEDTEGCGGEKKGGDGSDNAQVHPNHMPLDGWDESTILELAQHPTVSMSEQSARQYFNARTATHWIDGVNREVARTRKALMSDMLKWKVAEPSHGKSQKSGGNRFDLNSLGTGGL